MVTLKNTDDNHDPVQLQLGTSKMTAEKLSTVSGVPRTVQTTIFNSDCQSKYTKFSAFDLFGEH